MKKLSFSLFLFVAVTTIIFGAKYPVKKFPCEGISFRVYEDEFSNIIAAGEYGLRALKDGRWESIGFDSSALSLVTSVPGRSLYAAYADELFQLSEDSITNLSNSFPKSLAGFEILRLVSTTAGTYVHMNNRILKVDGDIIDYNYDDVLFAGNLNNSLIVQRENEGLFLLAANKFRRINESIQYASDPLLNILDLGNGQSLLLYQNAAVIYDGENFFPWDDEGIRWVRKLSIKHAVANSEGLFLSDSSNAIYQLSHSGELIQVIVPGAPINNLSSDKDGNLWVASNRAVYLIESASPIHLLTVNNESGTCAFVGNEDIILGTGGALYGITKFSFINDGLPGVLAKFPVNDVVCYLGQCFLAADKGLFLYDKTRVIKMREGHRSNGGILTDNESVFIEADEDGLSFYEQEYGRWIFRNHLYGIEEEVTHILSDEEGRLWAFQKSGLISHLNYDPVLHTINPVSYQIDHANGVFLVNGKPVVTARDGIYELDSRLNKFTKSQNYEDLLGSESDVLQLYQDADENIWYISSKEVGLLKVNDLGVKKSIEKITVVNLEGLINVEQPFITSLERERLLVGAKDGFLLVKTKELNSRPFQVHLHSLSSYDKKKWLIDAKYLRKKESKSDVIQLNKLSKSVELTFSSTYSVLDSNVLYSYNINDAGWNTPVQSNNLVASLPGGTNNIKVRVHYGIDNVSNTLVIPIFIPQDWYMMQNNQYIIVGGIAAFLLLLLFIFWRVARSRKKKMKLLEERISNTQSEMRELRDKNEILSAQLISAMNENDITHQLDKLQKSYDDPEVKKAIKKLVKKLKTTTTLIPSSITPDPEFISRLKLLYPQLTKKDVRLCSLLKMDLTTKDIAPILDITVRGVEISRYRLRKKLDLENEVVLADFLKQI